MAKSIALRLNDEVPELKDFPINLDVVEFAGLAHDLGHPPFGHNGEKALDDLMKDSGGFEGNAQTLRIIVRLEKKRFHPDAPLEAREVGMGKDGKEYRLGLNPTARSIAAILKYDERIPLLRGPTAPKAKGYYVSEEALVGTVKERVIGSPEVGALKTVECQIMDLADDIAYSTYDLEDTFKAGFLAPIDLFSLGDELLELVSVEVSKEVSGGCTADIVEDEILGVFGEISPGKENEGDGLEQGVKTYQQSCLIARNGYARTELTAELVGQFIEGVQFDYDAENPALSKVRLAPEIRRRVEVLKHLTRQVTIRSTRLKVVEYRGYEIVTRVFKALVEGNGMELLPNDSRELYKRSRDEQSRRRVVCDFVAGMTDSYAIDLYARLTSENARTIFKPL